MSKVYFKRVDSNSDLSKTAKELLERILSDEKIKLKGKVPIKVHFGEKGNKTFVKPTSYNGIIDYLKSNGHDTSYIETNVLYRSDRMKSDTHIKLAKDHGFTQIPIEIADGDIGMEYDEIPVNLKHFEVCKLGSGYSKYKQIIVTSHFKGHVLAGFGGALKQLAMGFAARGGKLDQHAKNVPTLNPLECTKCNVCLEECPVDAIDMGFLPKINKKKCIGCAACIAVCPFNAIKINWVSTMPKTFHEKLAEYAFAAAKDNDYIYISFATDMTKGCDCMAKDMKPIAKDLGIFASLDPVAIDTACMDMVDESEGKKVFKGRDTLRYAEEIGAGSREYEIVKL